MTFPPRALMVVLRQIRTLILILPRQTMDRHMVVLRQARTLVVILILPQTMDPLTVVLRQTTRHFSACGEISGELSSGLFRN